MGRRTRHRTKDFKAVGCVRLYITGAIGELCPKDRAEYRINGAWVEGQLRRRNNADRR